MIYPYMENRIIACHKSIGKSEDNST